jgi:hypothetical protein
MDIHQLKQRIDASGKKLVTLGNEYIKSKDDIAARIDYDPWMDCLKVKELDAATTRINSMVNEGLKMVRDRKMQEITAQRKRRNTLQSMVNL